MLEVSESRGAVDLRVRHAMPASALYSSRGTAGEKGLAIRQACDDEVGLLERRYRNRRNVLPVGDARGRHPAPVAKSSVCFVPFVLKAKPRTGELVEPRLIRR